MREIKFRAWQKYHKKMVEVTNISFDDNGEINGVATFVENQAPQHISYRDDLLGRFFLKDERGMVLELMQFTGLKDKKGVEIYEGDIIRFTNSIDEIDNEVGTVTWEQGECNFVAQYKTSNCVTQEGNGTTITIYLISNETYQECVEYEVIGNVYQNPELLEREN